MFTGIIETQGRVVRKFRQGDRTVLEIDARGPARELKAGDSVALDGICLTVTGRRSGRFSAEVGRETLRRTTLGSWRPGRAVNLETPARLGSPLGGHLVQGHVDGVSRVLGSFQETGGRRLRLEMTAPFSPYIVEKGSVAVNGVSLTVTETVRRHFELFLIPYTLRETNLGTVRRGSTVNVELDLIGKYVERWLIQAGRIPDPRSGSRSTGPAGKQGRAIAVPDDRSAT